jgi:hypothetical protein
LILTFARPCDFFADSAGKPVGRVRGSIDPKLKFPRTLRCSDLHPGLCRERHKHVLETTPLLQIDKALTAELLSRASPPPHFCKVSLGFNSGVSKTFSMCVARVDPKEYAVVMPCDIVSLDADGDCQAIKVRVTDGEVAITSSAAWIAEHMVPGDPVASAALLVLRVVEDIDSPTWSLLQPCLGDTPISEIKVIFDRDADPEPATKKNRSGKPSAGDGESNPIEEGLPLRGGL